MGVFLAFIGVVAIVLGMVFLYMKVIPQKFDGTFGNKFMQYAHDYFNFKKLYIESVLKFLFALVTVACIVAGVVGVVASVVGALGGIINMIRYGFSIGYVIVSFLTDILTSLAILVLGPVALRLVYEGILMFILLVKNVIEINNKTKAPAEPEESPVPVVQEEPVEN